MDKFQNLQDKSIIYRGQIITHCITLEKAIEEYICNSITKDEVSKYKIYVYLLDRMHFDGKISVFQTILQQSVSKDEFKKRYEKLMGKIRMVKDERNKFAHYLTYVTDESLERADKELSLVSFRDKVVSDKDVYNDHIINEKIEAIVKCTGMVYDLIKEPPPVPPSE
ncbi:hypothetical protein ACFQ3S_11035 [Mucilaginibacter terrae]|uniref:hypothetical protein n=1 Tax=Mucilaginibacter terrae TaxID=1955052 RepID=UPI0036385E0A